MKFLTDFSEYFESGVRKALPYTVMAFLLILNSVSTPMPMGVDAKAPLFLMGLYYWSIYRPTLIPPWLAFAAGIFVDLVGGLPLGLNACIFVLAQWFVSDQRQFLMGQSFIMIWFGFFVLSCFSQGCQWMVFALMHMAWPSLKGPLFSLAMGVAFFPVICVILHWTHKVLPAPARTLEPR